MEKKELINSLKKESTRKLTPYLDDDIADEKELHP